MFVSELKVLGFCVDLQIPVFDKIATYLGDFSFVELVLFFYIGLHRCCHEPRIQVYIGLRCVSGCRLLGRRRKLAAGEISLSLSEWHAVLNVRLR